MFAYLYFGSPVPRTSALTGPIDHELYVILNIGYERQ